jgi:hypothetical protein
MHDLLSPRGSPTENLGSLGGRGEVDVNIIKRVFVEERVRDSAKESAWVRSWSMRKPSLEDLHHDLDETEGIVNILERASRELSTIIDWDEGFARTRCVTANWPPSASSSRSREANRRRLRE